MLTTQRITGSGPTKILLIDDDELTRTTLREILSGAGYTVVREASDAAAGLKMALHLRPDVICLDVQMPGKSGLELLTDLKAQLPAVRVLMITSSNNKATVDACIAGGANGFIIKPFSAEKLLTTVRACVGARARQTAEGRPVPLQIR